MLSSTLQSILDNRLRYLPEITGKAIASVDWPTKVIDIGHKYGLHVEDVEEMQMVVLKSMTGLASPTDFESNLISATAASPATVEKIIQDMNDQIFEPVHEFVMNGGKAPDPLAVHGIELQSDSNIPDAVPSMPAPDTSITHSIDIPASPEPVVPKPQVAGSFNSFFINTPTKTNHSMIK